MTMVSATADIASAPARRISGRRLWLAALLVFAVVVPLVSSGYHVFQLTQIVMYAIAILGLNLLTGYSGQISLGNGSFYALGAYTAAILMTNAKLPYWATPPIAGAVCFVAGLAFGRSVTRLEGLYLALATYALGVATPQILKLDVLERWTGGNQGVVLSKPTSPFPSLLNDDQWLYFFCLGAAVILFIVAWNIVRGRTGRALIALRNHPIAAGTMGIPVAAYKSATFGLSAMYTGVAGALGALIAGFVGPDSFQIILSIGFLVGGVVGGIASIFGVLFGAAFIELVPDLTKQVSEMSPSLRWLAELQYPAYGVLLIATMLLMPGGMAGLVRSVELRIARHLHHPPRT
ncbi:MAG TPA: branched-chain amino acid ABC transporter permease [Kofleriaceae bacterium]|jgi:branched-chain amino acid transport system permease protein